MRAARHAGCFPPDHGGWRAAAGGARRGVPGRGPRPQRLRVPFALVPGRPDRGRPQPDRAVHCQGTGQPHSRRAGGPALKGVELPGAVVALTGASAGIGRAAALAFAREGSRLGLAARRLGRLEEVAAEVRALGADALAMELDVADERAVGRFIAAVVERFGRLDVIVNNAGSGVRGSVEETPVEDFRRLMEVNYLGTVHGCRAALPVMRRQASIVGHRALAGGAAYAATKAAQISLTESLRLELRGTAIAACSVHPVSTETEFAEVAARASAGRKGGPVGPMQSADAVARAIVACARRPRAEVYPYPLARSIVWLNALSPRLVDWLASRAIPTKTG
ncbi:MAG: hypothetical protein DMF81_09755 [Acidobacteria bacterium]|nr:MAG: hypothetical protein DMF81_09755 [Acidobacteriota bacterium]